MKNKRRCVNILPWILLIISAIIAAFSDRIDMAAPGNDLVKKVLLVFCIGIILVIFIPFVFKILLHIH